MVNLHNRTTLEISYAKKLNPKTRAGLTAELHKNGLLIDADPRLSELKLHLVSMCPEPADPISHEQFEELWQTSFLMEKSFSGPSTPPNRFGLFGCRTATTVYCRFISALGGMQLSLFTYLCVWLWLCLWLWLCALVAPLVVLL